MKTIQLKKITKSDKKYFAVWWRDVELAKLTSGILDSISDYELSKYFTDLYNSKNDYHFMIVADDTTIGHISLSNREGDWHETQIVIGNKDYWGQGYGSESIKLLMIEAKKLNISKIFLEVRPTNTRAIKAYIKSGFIEAGNIYYPDNKFLSETLRMEYSKLIMNNISDFKNINTPSELMDFMNDNITYGYISKTGKIYIDQNEEWNKDWFTQCAVQSGESVLKTKCGNCWDQVELERKWFQEHDYQFMTIFSWFEINKPNKYPTHTFLAYKENNKWYWFEHAFTSHRGIREYNSLVELISDVKNKQLKSVVKSGVGNPKDKKLIKAYEYKEPVPNLCVGDYIDHVVKGTLV